MSETHIVYSPAIRRSNGKSSKNGGVNGNIYKLGNMISLWKSPTSLLISVGAVENNAGDSFVSDSDTSTFRRRKITKGASATMSGGPGVSFCYP